MDSCLLRCCCESGTWIHGRFFLNAEPRLGREGLVAQGGTRNGRSRVRVCIAPVSISRLLPPLSLAPFCVGGEGRVRGRRPCSFRTHAFEAAERFSLGSQQDVRLSSNWQRKVPPSLEPSPRIAQRQAIL